MIQTFKIIRFRGKRKDDGRWVQGLYVITPLTSEVTAPYEDGHYFLTGTQRHCISHDGCVHEIVPYTVGQFTGLVDRNGNEIYEGDIIKMTWYNSYGAKKEAIGVVRYDQEDCRYIIGARNWLQAHGSHLEIIGNTHDNPEILNA